ncbi:hypothetical protein GCM10010341_48020 [Streptomyces noursei]|nr:hypothetical protein GCM10010341_48020 [Streptomyces noursei]
MQSMVALLTAWTRSEPVRPPKSPGLQAAAPGCSVPLCFAAAVEEVGGFFALSGRSWAGSSGRSARTGYSPEPTVEPVGGGMWCGTVRDPVADVGVAVDEGVASAGVATRLAIVAQAARPPTTHLGQVKR